MVICVVCGNAVGSSLRRVLHPPSCEGTRAVRDFYVAHVHSFAFDVTGTKQIYVCKKPCLRNWSKPWSTLRKPTHQSWSWKLCFPYPVLWHHPRVTAASGLWWTWWKQEHRPMTDGATQACRQMPPTLLLQLLVERGYIQTAKWKYQQVLGAYGTPKRPRVTTRGHGTKRGHTEPSRGAPASKRRFQPQTPPAIHQVWWRWVTLWLFYSMHVLIVLHFDWSVKVTYLKAGQKAKKYILRSPYKRIVKSAYYRKKSYTARVCMRNPAMKEAALQEVLKVGNGFLSTELIHCWWNCWFLLCV